MTLLLDLELVMSLGWVLGRAVGIAGLPRWLSGKESACHA